MWVDTVLRVAFAAGVAVAFGVAIWWKNSERYVYHYTDRTGAEKIKRSQRIRKSEDVKTDACYGKGVYLTSMAPSNGKNRILSNNYDSNSSNFCPSPKIQDKADYFVRIKEDDLLGVQKVDDNRRNVFLFPEEVQLNRVDHDFGCTSSS